jgi:HTH-type transcriptional regulator/antitoxin HigA
MLRPIKNEQQYEASLERVYALMQEDLAPGSSESDELEVLSILVKTYENEHYPIAPPHTLEAIRFRLEQLDLPESELSELLGARSKKSEILSGKRKLSLSMIRKLNERLKIPASILIQEY